MLKHLLTLACPRRCPYCVVRHVPPCEANLDLDKLTDAYLGLRAGGHRAVMLTGGEPLRHPDFGGVLTAACEVFREVHVMTQEPAALGLPRCWVTSVVFSLHDYPRRAPPFVRTDAPVYASVLAAQLDARLPQLLLERGYAGLTLNEDQFGGGPTIEEALARAGANHLLSATAPLSLKLNRRGHCANETVLLPDLTVVRDFTRYLGGAS